MKKIIERHVHLYRLERLKKAVDAVLFKTKDVNKDLAEYWDNTKVFLKNMSDDLDKFEALIKGERKPTVGVFGCPSRGKSTLLNVLLGVNMLPMRGKAGTTRFGIELSYKDTEEFQITVKYKNKPPETFELDEDSARYELEFYSNQAHLVNQDITKIEVEGPFCSFLGNSVIFIDTPGVELGASADDLPDDFPDKQDFEADTQRALVILSSVDVVIFCMINKYKEKKDADFYTQAIRGQYRPINVITAADKRDEGQTNEDIKIRVRNDYHLVKGDTVVVSAKEAFDKIKKARSERKTISKLLDAEFTGENLEEFKELKRKIQKKVEITDADIENRLTRFEEFYEKLKKDASDKGIKLDNLSNMLYDFLLGPNLNPIKDIAIGVALLKKKKN
jgi:GTPase Era involved in 16S rRNA processing